MPRGGRKPLIGTHDVRNLHEMVVDNIGKVVSGVAVRLEQYQVVELAVVKGDIAANEVIKRCFAFNRCLETYHRRYALRLSL